MRFTKMHGVGNDYVYVDGFRHTLPTDPSRTAVLISDRHKGIGADGLILICPSEVADAEMRMYNADGSLSEMCGNGIRCVAKYVFDHGIVPQSKMDIATGAGIKTVEVFAESGIVRTVRVDMGSPILSASQIPTLLADGDEQVVNVPLTIDDATHQVTCVSMGNPHCVVVVDGVSSHDETDELVLGLGPKIELHRNFPARVNVEFVVVESTTEVHQRTWERGSGETMACGTGASAVCVAGVLTGRTERKIKCHLTGGTLELEWDADTNHVFMTGPAEEVFRGEFPLDL